MPVFCSMASRLQELAQKLNGLNINCSPGALSEVMSSLTDYFMEESGSDIDISSDDEATAFSECQQTHEIEPDMRNLLSDVCDVSGENGPKINEEEMKMISKTVQDKCCPNDRLSRVAVETILRTRQQSRGLRFRCDYHVNHFCLFLLRHFDACLRDSSKTEKAKSKNTERQLSRLMSMFHGNAVCIDAFHFLHDMSRKTT